MMNRSAPAATIVPILIYDDVGKSLAWLCCAFGFVERLRVPGPDGVIMHAQLAVREGALMTFWASAASLLLKASYQMVTSFMTVLLSCP